MNVALQPIISSLEDKRAVIFGLDNVLYPAKDYYLQVFYMFGQFIEFLEARPVASAITEDLKALYLSSDTLPALDDLSSKYNLTTDYADKLDRLYHQVQLPLKLELYPAVLQILRQLIDKNIMLLVLATGDPFLQLNKLKQMEWHGMDKCLRVYFADELKFKNLDPVAFIFEDNNLRADEVAWIEHSDKIRQIATLQPLETLDPNILSWIQQQPKSN